MEKEDLLQLWQAFDMSTLPYWTYNTHLSLCIVYTTSGRDLELVQAAMNQSCFPFHENIRIQMHEVQVVVVMMMMMMVRMVMMRMTVSFGVGVCQGDSVVAMLFMMLRNDGHFKEA